MNASDAPADPHASLRHKRVVVVGLAQTGVSVARFCAARGALVTVTDAKPAAKLQGPIDALDGCATLELGGHLRETFTSADLIVMSPGVPELAETRAARKAGVDVIAEIELAYRFLHPQAHLIAITGTNGKSTTTALIGALCQAASERGAPPTFCGGNLGNHPLIEAVDHPANTPGGFVVAEVAGFMLETCTSFRPRVAVCLNISEDHLDRYGTMEVYASMKQRVFRWQTQSDFAIANARCPLTLDGMRAAAGQAHVFESAGPLPSDAYGAYLSTPAPAPARPDAIADEPAEPQPASTSDHREIIIKTRQLAARGVDACRFPVVDLPLVGLHNLENAMAAYLAAHLVGVSDDAIRTGARSFRPQRHRMEEIGEKDGVLYFDDSKGTNVAAVAASVRGFPRPVVLIAGGVDKGGSYAPLFAALEGTARALVLIGEAAPLIRRSADEAGFAQPVVEATSMHEAVVEATKLAKSGDAVILSPACSSYDMFRNFAERGTAFRDAVSAIGGRRIDITTER